MAKDINDKSSEREQIRERNRLILLKESHLVNMKKVKIESHISTVELNPGFRVSVVPCFSEGFLCATECGSYLLRFIIDEASVRCEVPYNKVDAVLPKVVESIRLVNDFVPELRHALINEGEHGLFGYNTSFFVTKPLRGSKIGMPILGFPSCRVASRISAVLTELSAHIHAV